MDNSDVNCILPWVHLHVWPNGNVLPCCMSDSKKPIGKWPDQSLKEIWNSKPMRELRLNMLNGKKSDQCKRCYVLEQNGYSSLRTNSNKKYLYQDRQQTTNSDGSLDYIKIAYLDVRFSNICNLKCRSCGPELSSAWHDDEKILTPNSNKPRIVNVNKTGQFWDELVPYLDETEEVMFAGGESLIMDEHYKLLDYWISKKKFDVRLRYTTNFTNFKYKNRDLFSLWSKFDDILVSASLDGSHERGEYLRKNMDWNDVVANRIRMIEEVPNVMFDIAPTVSLMNVIHLPDFHREWVEKGLLGLDKVRLNLLTYPPYMSVRVLPFHLKEKAADKILTHIDWLVSVGANDESIQQWEGVLSFMGKTDDSHLLKNFKFYTDSVDKIRNESLLDVFPELDQLYKELI